MKDTELYSQILGLKQPWQVRHVDVEMGQGEVTVEVERNADEKLCCPSCGRQGPGYDSRRRRWRHLDTCQYKTIEPPRLFRRLDFSENAEDEQSNLYAKIPCRTTRPRRSAFP